MNRTVIRLLAAAGLALGAAACGAIPSSGPTAPEIRAAASIGNEVGFTVVEVTPAVLAELGRAKTPSFQGRFPIAASAGPRVIGVGDALAVSIWEAGDGGLFSPGSAGSIVVGGSRNTQLPPTVVDRSGDFTVPYAGRIKAAGRTPRDVERTIQEKLKDRAIQPQVIVNIQTNTANTVNVLGEVGGGGKVSLTQRDDRLLDVIAMAGGAKVPPYDTLVRLTRGGTTGTVSMQRVIADPRENIGVQPGDTIVLLRNILSFTSFGATGRVAQVPFEAEQITLAEAMAKVGGPIDTRADPTAVFLFRFEDADTAARLSPGVARASVGQVPIIYKIDFRTAEAYFYAQTFPIRDKDTVYVANALTYDLAKFIGFAKSGASAWFYADRISN